MKRVAFYTLGCKVNSYDTEAMRSLFLKRGYRIVDFNEEADIYIVNTCTVTHLGDRKSRQMLRRAKRKNPDSLVVATGCYAQVNPEAIEAIDEVDLIVGTKSRSKIVDIVEEAVSSVSDYKLDEEYEALSIERDSEHTRAYIKIQDGCNQFCTYCIVPYARGPVRSRKADEAIDEITRLVENGYHEFVLTGIHIASFGTDRDEEDALISLIEKIDKIDGVERIRLSSLEPSIITSEFLERLSKIESFCSHFHLSLQSGSREVLRRMGRRYTPEEYLSRVDLIREYFVDPGITTDIIVGFPGETEEEFEETLEFIEKVHFSRIHVFPYSVREGTPAQKLPGAVPADIKKERAHILSQKERRIQDEFYREHDGEEERVLIEREKEPGLYTGYTRNYIPVEIEDSHLTIGDIVKVKLEANDREVMEAKVIT